MNNDARMIATRFDSAACRAAPVGTLNILPVVITFQTDYYEDG